MPKVRQDQDISEAVAASYSISGALRKLRRARVGTNYTWLREAIIRLNLSTEHFRPVFVGERDLDAILIKDSPATTGNVKKRVLKAGLLEEVCAICRLGPQWQDKPLTLRLDHINGDSTDNRLVNLRMLCPNCDSQSDFYCGRNKQPAVKVVVKKDPDTGKVARRKKIDWPDTETLYRRVKEKNLSVVGRELAVSDNAIRKHLKLRGYIA
jgi:hypothetical protein